MSINEEYLKWLFDNPKGWTDATVNKYSRVPSIVSKDMIEEGIISKSLLDMSKTELECSVYLILSNAAFLNKDSVGNKMYSNGLKQYCAFVRATLCDTNSDNILDAMINDIKKDESLSLTEKEAIVKSRIGQGDFRKGIVSKYNKCIITGVDNPKLLVASHIKPWSQSNNIERLSAENGLLLTPTYDKLFDCGLITFYNGKLTVSSFVGKENEQRLCIPANEKFDLLVSKEQMINMQYHNDVIFVR